MYGANATSLIFFLIEWIVLLSLPWIVISVFVYWVIRTLKKKKNAQAQERNLKEEL
jgi:heme/copper-type cytochrome/quinol oxidase subunit 2